MLSLKEKIEAKKSILCSLADVPESTANDIFTGIFEGKEMKDIDDLLDELQEDKYVDKYIPTGKREYAYVLTRRGEDRAEFWSCQERWDKAMEICERLHDFSERTVDGVFGQILSKDISELIGSPFTEVTNAMYQLAGEISSYNIQNVFRR